MDAGGIETQLMRIYRNIDKSKVQFDFLVHRNESACYDDEIQSMGGKIFRVSPYNPIKFYRYVREMEDFFRAHPEYNIMLAHSDLCLGALIAAKRAGVPIRIAYSHNAKPKFGLKKVFLDLERLFIKRYCTDMFAVSRLAAKYTFGNKALESGCVKVIKNGIIASDFIFDEDTRNEVRKELAVEQKFVVGHVGRFMEQKNHKFLLEIFYEICKRKKNAHLLLIGEGRLENEIRVRAEQLGIHDKISFLGTRSDVNRLVQAMDVFLLPSLWEGFPNVAIESQAAALPIFMSDNITEEAAFTVYAKRLSLKCGAKEWAKIVCESYDQNEHRTDMSPVIEEEGYDVQRTAKWYEDMYMSMADGLTRN